MEHRMLRPFLFQGVDSQPLEQLLLPLIISLQGRNEQALPEPTRTAKEIDFPFRHQSVNKSSLIYINITIINDAFKILYANWVFHNASVCSKLQRNKLFSKIPNEGLTFATHSHENPTIFTYTPSALATDVQVVGVPMMCST